MKIEGAISVKAAIESKKREVKEVFIDKDNKNKNFNYIRKISKLNNIKINEISKDDFSSFNPGKTFGGIIAECSLRKEDEFDNKDIFYITGVEDPFNLGYMIRNLYAFGINNLILDAREYEKLDGQILKSSAGAYEFINIKYTDNPLSVIETYKKNNYKVYALSRGDNSKDIFNETFNNPSLFIIGGEKRGINSNILSLADSYLYIPYGNDFRNSLNASNALACVSTLLFKQRK